jgi:hypothetical protein
LSALIAIPASAHDADVIAVQLEPDASGALLSELVVLTADSLALLAPVDADGDGLLTQADLDARAAAIASGVWDDMPLSAGAVPCARSAESALVREGLVELQARFRCVAGDLRQDFRLLRVLPANYRVTLSSRFDAAAGQAFAQGSLTSVSIARPTPPKGWSVAALERGLAEGLGLFFTLGILAGLAALGVAFQTWTRALQALPVIGAGVVLGAFLALSGPSPVLLALATIALAWRRGEVPLLTCGACGMVLGLQGADHVAAEALGAAGGLAGPGALWLLGAVAAGQLARRRKWDRVLRWVLAAITCFAAGFRVLG